MSQPRGWSTIAAEAQGLFVGAGRYPIRAYSEFMPPPLVGLKPYDLGPPGPADAAGWTFGISDDDTLDVSEYEQTHELTPGLHRIGGHLADELGRLQRGERHALSRTLLADNPAWPADLADAARHGRLADRPLLLVTALALSRSQDDKGNDRWTLFGGSHRGAGEALWRSLDGDDGTELDRLVSWLRAAPTTGARVLADDDELPTGLRARRLTDLTRVPPGGVLVTFRPFAALPAALRTAYLEGALTLVPSPASLVFFHHPRYRALATQLPRATQIPLLHLFPRIEGSCAIRIPQSGWLDEVDPATAADHGHHVVSHVARRHRWERHAKDDHGPRGDGRYVDKVSVALFATDPDALELYGKPMARNVELWTEAYALVLDGPRADAAAIARAAAVVDAGGRFGYRFHFPAMRAGARTLCWHRPVLARIGPGGPEVLGDAVGDRPPLGVVTAELDDPSASAPLFLRPRLLDRPGHHDAARLFPRERGHARDTTCHNARKLLDHAAFVGGPLAPALARSLLHVAKDVTIAGWLAGLPAAATDHDAGAALAAQLAACVGPEADPGPAVTFAHTATRAFEEEIWRSIAGLAEGEFRQKENADAIAVNAGKTGGPAAALARLEVAARRDLEALGDHLHARYRVVAARHGMTGRAACVDHAFRWETDFTYPWMEGWAKSQAGAAAERNVVFVIPGRRRDQAVIMADHYDTAYMEDVYDADRGGDKLRAPAAGADDNHSATTALLLAAEVLLPLARDGKLERDVWLVHLTGEEFPADSLGARALVQGLIERSLTFTTEAGDAMPVGDVRVVGAYVLDMIGHNTQREPDEHREEVEGGAPAGTAGGAGGHAPRGKDVFQIAPGEGTAAAHLAHVAARANARWNRDARTWNQAAERHGKGRAARMPDGSAPPPPFAHLPLRGEIRVEWEPRSALYNTDGQVFSDCGVPVVLFMENYDISRTGYHDTLDTMANIDLDYCAAITAIAIEAVVEVAMEASEPVVQLQQRPA
jgi:hypothetical protein